MSEKAKIFSGTIFNSLVFFSAAIILIGCGDVESYLQIIAEHHELPADGEAETRITVRAVFRNESVSNGTRITLNSSAGHFTDRDRDETTLSTTAGEASVNWAAPYERDGKLFEGEVTLSASYIDPYGVNEETRIIIQIVPPPPIDGGSFRFWCSAQNIQRPSTTTGNLEVPCTVEARDINGRTVQPDNIRFGFMTEVGRMEFDRDGNLNYVLTPGLAERPKQVPPLGDSATSGEPRWTDQSTGTIRNPRDGIATLVVHAHGRPSGDQDIFQGEPFVDANDDGQWNPGEEFYDENKNGEYDMVSGDTSDRRIWRWTKIMITGPLSEEGPESAEGLALWDSGGQHHRSIHIPRGGEVQVDLLLVDENLNPIASHPGSTQNFIRITTVPRGIVSPREQSLTNDIMGLSFNHLTGEVLAGNTRTGYLQGALTYSFTIPNERRADDEGPPVGWRMESVEIRRLPHPGTTRLITESISAQNLPRGYFD